MSDPELVELSSPSAPGGGLLRRTLSNPAGAASVLILLTIIVMAIIAPLVAPQGPNYGDLHEVLKPGSADHVLGTDGAGRDVFARLVFGARASLTGALLSVGIAAVVGIPFGMMAGFYGGWFDTVGLWISSLLMALPGIVVLLAFRASVSPSMWAAMAVFGVLLAPSFFNLVRAGVASVRNELYVDAARVSGVSDVRIISRHVLRVVRAPIIIQAAMVMAIALMIQSGLEFLGLGDLSTPSWGSMLNEGFQNIFRAEHLVMWPGLTLTVTIGALALLANALRDALDGSGGGPGKGKARKKESPATARRAVKDAPEPLDPPDPAEPGSLVS
ncbi:MAG: ABC transporter permease, partial [Bifidobacteriaceae bacterium]|nr:ABC transporter permease [Bifidobacteriaceae bacterium]